MSDVVITGTFTGLSVPEVCEHLRRFAADEGRVPTLFKVSDSDADYEDALLEAFIQPILDDAFVSIEAEFYGSMTDARRWLDAFIATLSRQGVEADFDEIVRRFQMLYLGDDDRPGLRDRERSLMKPVDLRASIGDRPVGVVTGRPRAEAEWFLRRSDLDSMVDVLVAREDAPLKPDPRGVELALERLGIRTAWFLGDTEDDLLAARRVGGRRVLPVGVVPTGSVDSSRLRRRLRDAGAGVIVDAGPACIELLRGAGS